MNDTDEIGLNELVTAIHESSHAFIGRVCQLPCGAAGRAKLHHRTARDDTVALPGGLRVRPETLSLIA
jgi:hypothetical protein